MKSNNFINVIPTNYGIDNCLFTFSFPAKPTYSRTIMGRSQKQQQVRSTVGGIRLTGSPRLPLEAPGRLYQARQFKRYSTLRPNQCGPPINQPNKSTKRRRTMWRRRRRSRYAKVGSRDYDQGHKQLASTTRPCMCSPVFSKAFYSNINIH
ncbi:hypothetical protein ASPSYDRAFT_847720 [Aspergillus sydowii CBS 593.65]|uniref:Uncharacterized protein n=1 Tax=Aspergillus sydowii CBS 593.65 TaxID=1036612 RepID=A0A1L9SXT5_9EURO|nr:uncharacterized protein ASPSYDRAFT_847720 [Aspergillus sydowii CBS 593.65]OJJ51891.1 hypothetical protein ASPSYDRAFT_847720 [Aspergillus sydowii CBS 593.65]